MKAYISCVLSVQCQKTIGEIIVSSFFLQNADFLAICIDEIAPISIFSALTSKYTFNILIAVNRHVLNFLVLLIIWWRTFYVYVYTERQTAKLTIFAKFAHVDNVTGFNMPVYFTRTVYFWCHSKLCWGSIANFHNTLWVQISRFWLHPS